jgi:hypothetical protein
MELKLCRVCGVKCRPLRCTQCQKVWYCSRKCQGEDWKAGHREACKAQAALAELQGLAMEMPIEEAKQQFFMTKDALETPNEVINQLSLQVPTKPKTSAQDNKPIAVPNAAFKSAPTLSTSSSKRDSKSKQNTAISAAIKSSFNKEEKSRSSFLPFVVEDMRHISKYQLTLQSASSSISDPADIEVDILPSTSQPNWTSIQLSSTLGSSKKLLFQIELPRKIVHQAMEPLQVNEEGNLQLRLEYQGDPSYQFSDIPTSQLDPTSINSIQCRFCELPLLINNPIERVLPLPVGHWEEIADYLICYSGVSWLDPFIIRRTSL